MTKKDLSQAASAMGKRGYQIKVEKLGLDEIQKIARANGRLGGRPKRGSKKLESN
jgi:hypothetical protein